MDEDIALLDRYESGDEYALEELVMKYQRKIYALAFRVTGNSEDAKDLTQKSFLQAFTGLKKFRRQASFYTWLYRITLNTCRNHLRQKDDKTTDLKDTLTDGDRGALSDIIDQQRKMTVKASLVNLPERQRAAVILRAYDGLSLKETAEVMNCSVGAVKAHYHNGIKKLRDLLIPLKGSTERKGSEK